MRYPGFTQFDYETNKKSIFDTIVSHIDDASKKKASRIYIKDLHVIDERVDVIANSDQWNTCLTKALDFYKQIEDYESCSTCQKLIDRLNKPTKKSKSNARKKN
jgi:hypothetical protein